MNPVRIECAARKPAAPPGMLCTEETEHAGDHRVVVDGEVVATWRNSHTP